MFNDSDCLRILEQAMSYSNSKTYEKHELDAMNAKLKEPLRILANGTNLLKFISGTDDEKSDNEKSPSIIQNYLEAIVPYLSETEYTSLTFGITENELNLKIDVHDIILLILLQTFATAKVQKKLQMCKLFLNFF